MLVVEKVTNLRFMKIVGLVAASAEAHKAQKVLGGGFMKLINVRFEVRAGERLNLPYPFWAAYAVGQSVDLSDIARHPLGPHWTPIS
jgi:hypothetical protein